jgi:hypothetical protein
VKIADISGLFHYFGFPHEGRLQKRNSETVLISDPYSLPLE